MHTQHRYNVASVLSVLPFRCGHVCTRAVDADRCHCPDGLDRAPLVFIENARQRGGPCGPDANHMKFQGQK